MKLEIGMKVRTKIDGREYFSDEIIPKGTIGKVGAVDCPNVQTPGYFQCVDFMRDGKRL